MSDDQTRTGADTPAPTTAKPPRRWLRWVVRPLLCLIIFAAGGAAGSAVTVRVIRDAVWYRIQHPEEMPRRLANRLRWPLGLSSEQKTEIEHVFERRQRSLQSIRARYQPEIEAELDVIERELADVLDEDQQTRWREFFTRIRTAWTPPLPTENTSDPDLGSSS